MKILLTTLNSQYVHTSPALKYLYTVLQDTPDEVTIREFTINNEYSHIYGELVRANCDMVCFSCYIWNIELIKALAADLKKARPDLVICLGGPEVSFEGHVFAVENPWVDFIICGEGEYSLYRLCEVLRRRSPFYDGREVTSGLALDTVPGLIYRKGGKVYVNQQIEPMDLNSIPFMYSVLECETDRVVYYESSRGCPFRCSYCMSSVEKSVRPLDMARVKRELKYFIHKKAMQVKFIDRTFNYDPARAYEIIEFIIENDNGVTNFHFEICADLMTDELTELLSQARKGLIQLEIGIQSANAETLRAVNRKENVYPVLYNTEKLIRAGNIHIHVDLIAGLPYETYDQFAMSFDKVYRLGADAFQMGFLKVLKGTEMARMSMQYGMVYQDRAPYEIISNRWISSSQMVRLKSIEKMLNIYYNRSGFTNSLEYLMNTCKLKPFEFFEKLADFYYDAGYHNINRKKEEQYRILRKFSSEILGEEKSKIEKILEKDLKSAFNDEEVRRFLKKGWEI